MNRSADGKVQMKKYTKASMVTHQHSVGTPEKLPIQWRILPSPAFSCYPPNKNLAAGGVHTATCRPQLSCRRPPLPVPYQNEHPRHITPKKAGTGKMLKMHESQPSKNRGERNAPRATQASISKTRTAACRKTPPRRKANTFEGRNRPRILRPDLSLLRPGCAGQKEAV